MKQLKELLYKVSIEAVAGKIDRSVSHVVFDSRQASLNDLFVALRGVSLDGHEYISNAIEKGVSAVVCETMPEVCKDNVVYVQVKNAHVALGVIADNYFDNPSSKIKLVGITGTNGKTTIAVLLFELFNNYGWSSGLISTVGNRYGQFEFSSTHTTPDPIQINKLLREMVDANVTHCFMEVSSHGIAQHRTASLNFSGGVFTNLTHEHLDYHKTFKEYRDVKKLFFDQLPKSAFALVNVDDKNGTYMLQNTKARKWSYAMKQMADYTVAVLECHLTGMLLKLNQHEVWTTLVGRFNALNLAAIFASSQLLGMDTLASLKYTSQLESVSGRFQKFHTEDDVTVIVDYAHTPDALKNVLETINSIRTKNESLITIIGCGGNRDTEKRPLMGEIAAAMSTKVIFTSDNPRSEEPSEIMAQMMAGVSPENHRKIMKVTCREEAITVASQFCEKGDIILLAGKGHENYQEIKGKRFLFNDFQVARKIFLKHM